MEFLNPAALYSLLLLPLLLIPYLIRRRPRRVVFSSLLLIRDFAERVSAGRSGIPPIFFLHLLILALLLMTLGEPSFSKRAINVALVLDNSASMQAREDGRSRFQAAVNEAQRILGALPAGARVDLYATAPRLASIGAVLTPDEARRRIVALTPVDVGERAIDHGAELSRLARERGYEHLHFVTDHPAEGQSRTVRVATVASPRDNIAVTSFRVSRAALNSAQLGAQVEIRSFSAAEEKFKLNIKAGGKVVAARAMAIAPGKTASASFDGLAPAPYYEAEIAVDDALALDNRRFAVAPAGGLKILAVSPRPDALASLRSIPGVELEIVSPDAYAKGNFQAHALEIFHYSTPAALPDRPALFILPPAENPLVRTTAHGAPPAVTGWREAHPLTRYVNFALFRPRYARPLKLGRTGEAVIESADGALAVASEERRTRFLALGFDPLPFLGRQNLPMSIFTLNAFEWLSAAESRPLSTGERLNARVQREIVAASTGQKIDPRSNPIALYQGLYRLNGGSEYLAVNFDDGNESNLRERAPIQLRDEPGAAAEESASALLWRYFLFGALALLIIEWFIHPFPSRRRKAEAAR